MLNFSLQHNIVLHLVSFFLEAFWEILSSILLLLNYFSSQRRHTVNIDKKMTGCSEDCPQVFPAGGLYYATIGIMYSPKMALTGFLSRKVKVVD